MVTYWTTKSGYEKCHGNKQKEDGTWINTSKVTIHRLTAVAWYGMDAIDEKDIHHRIPIPWLNIESNIIPLPSIEHSILTADYRRRGMRESVKNDVLGGLSHNG